MAILVVAEAVAIALLGVLVCGLLRSHAEILRTLHRLGAGEFGATAVATAVASPKARLSSVRTAADIVGATPAGEAVQVGVRNARHDTLLAFLSSGCSTCEEFWRAFAKPVSLPANTRLVVVTKDPAEESARRVRELAPAGVPVVMSSQAWKDYAAPVAPFFMHVDGATGAIAGQGTGGTWAQVSSLLTQARGDIGDDVEAGVDRQLLAAGIQPGDPSLYPSRHGQGPDGGR